MAEKRHQGTPGILLLFIRFLQAFYKPKTPRENRSGHDTDPSKKTTPGKPFKQTKKTQDMNPTDRLSKNLTYGEATKSRTAIKYGIKNEPNRRQLQIMTRLAMDLFQPIRDHFNKPIYVSSFYRSQSLNKKIPGAATRSDHMILDTTAAIDLDNDGLNNGVTNADIFWYIYDNLPFYKLIWEHGDNQNPSWVHISWDPSKNHRKHVYKAIRVNGKTTYQIFKESEHR